jgi:serine/threonine protein kinase
MAKNGKNGLLDIKKTPASRFIDEVKSASSLDDIIQQNEGKVWFSMLRRTIREASGEELEELDRGEFEQILKMLQDEYKFLGDKIGQLRLVGGLGKGGFGHVYYAMYDKPLNFNQWVKKSAKRQKLARTEPEKARKMYENYTKSDFAVKILPPDAWKDEEIIDDINQMAETPRRFIREGKATQTLKKEDPKRSTHIVSLSDVAATLFPGATQPLYYYAMEILPTELDYNKSNSIEQVVEWIADAANGFAYAHDKKILHRDIKPENLRLDKKGVVKITDWGLLKKSKQDESLKLTAKGTVMGTIHYMSPEQIRAEKASNGFDIYSLGATLYYLLTGHFHWGQDIIEDEVSRANKEGADISLQNRLMTELAKNPDIIDPRKYNKKIPQALVDIITKATAPYKEERYRSMKVLEKDLRDFLEGKEVKVDLNTLKRRQWKEKHKILGWARDNKLIAGGMSLAFAALLTGTAYLGLRGPEKSAEQVKAEQVDKRLKNYHSQYQTAMDLFEKGKEKEALDKLTRLKKTLADEKETAFSDLKTKVKADASRVKTTVKEKGLERNVRAEYGNVQRLEAQGLLVEAFGGYVALQKKWETQAAVARVRAVLEQFSKKPQQLRQRLLRGEGKNEVHKKLEFILTDLRNRSEHTEVSSENYQVVGMLLAEKVIEPYLATHSPGDFPVAVKKDGTWWSERIPNLFDETKSAPGDFTTTLWRLYAHSKDKKWLQHARAWTAALDQETAETVSGYTAKAMVETLFYVLDNNLDPENNNTYKRQIQRLADLIVQNRWNDELEFLMHKNAETGRNNLHIDAMNYVVALYKAHNSLGNEDYKRKADATLDKILKHLVTSRLKELFDFADFVKKDGVIQPEKGGFNYRLGSIENYINFSMNLFTLYDVSKDERFLNLAIEETKKLFDNIDVRNVPKFGIYYYTVDPNTRNAKAQKYRTSAGQYEVIRLLPMLSNLAIRISEHYGRIGDEASAKHYRGMADKARKTSINYLEFAKSYRGFTRKGVGGLIDNAGNVAFTPFPSDIEPTDSFFSQGLRAFTEALLNN